jgi:hypothetical protein
VGSRRPASISAIVGCGTPERSDKARCVSCCRRLRFLKTMLEADFPSIESYDTGLHIKGYETRIPAAGVLSVIPRRPAESALRFVYI